MNTNAERSEIHIRTAILAELDRRGWSLYKLAKESDVNQQTVCSHFREGHAIGERFADKYLSALSLEIKVRDNGR